MDACTSAHTRMMDGVFPLTPHSACLACACVWMGLRAAGWMLLDAVLVRKGEGRTPTHSLTHTDACRRVRFGSAGHQPPSSRLLQARKRKVEGWSARAYIHACCLHIPDVCTSIQPWRLFGSDGGLVWVRVGGVGGGGCSGRALLAFPVLCRAGLGCSVGVMMMMVVVKSRRGESCRAESGRKQVGKLLTCSRPLGLPIARPPVRLLCVDGLVGAR